MHVLSELASLELVVDTSFLQFGHVVYTGLKAVVTILLRGVLLQFKNKL